MVVVVMMTFIVATLHRTCVSRSVKAAISFSRRALSSRSPASLSSWRASAFSASNARAYVGVFLFYVYNTNIL